ncbi:MAG: DUF3147 family protein [Candidatus Woesearchaeota archaeon]
MDIFLFKLILTFIVGGIWVNLGIVLAERYGTKIGGVIIGLPSTVAVTLFFIGWTQSVLFASQSTTIIPIIMGVSGLFVVIYILLAKRGFLLAIISALMFWLLFSLILVKINFNNLLYSIIGLIILMFISYFILETKSKVKSEGKQLIKYTAWQLAFRSILGGSIMVLGVFLAKVGGPLIGGAFAAFPAMFLSTIIISHFSHGKNFSAAIMKTMVVSGSVNISAYAIAVRYFYPMFGLILGTIFSFLVSFVTGYLVYQFVNKKMI